MSELTINIIVGLFCATLSMGITSQIITREILDECQKLDKTILEGKIVTCKILPNPNE